VPATSLVFVQSKDGNTGAADPSTLGGGITDKHLIYEGLSRVAADAVLAGAETIRGGDLVFSVWRRELVELRETMRLPRHPMQVVTTLRGLPFDDTLLFNVPELQVVVITVHSWADRMSREFAKRPWMTVIEMDDPDGLGQAFGRLRAMGVARLSCIGGRTIARTLIGRGLVQDLYLTTSARPGGEPNTPLTEEPLSATTIVRKVGTGPDAGITFEHRVL
jgi:riboflavin biosynthesis pyrimidine reductase